MSTSATSLREEVSRTTRAVIGIAVAAIASGVFWLTAYPTITWWDASSYSLAAATLGVTSSPGSLLLTLIGWVATRGVPGLTTARVLALTGATIATLAICLIYSAALAIRRALNPAVTLRSAVSGGAGLGALAFAFSATFWEYATQFTPYILSAAFTALILVAMLRWWRVADEPTSWRALALVTLLFGIDFSVHRTNALLLPTAIAWVLIRRPRTLAEPRSWVGALGGMALGLSVQVLVLPIARATTSPLVMSEPTTWSRWWDYVSLAQVGGGFLINLWPRQAPILSFQFVDLLRSIRDTAFTVTGPLGPLGAVPGVAAIAALAFAWRRDKRLGTALAIGLLLHATATVVYFNIPANYFRSLHRHYLPVLVFVAVLASTGMSVLADNLTVAGRRRRDSLALGVAVMAGAVLLVAAPVAQLARNWRASNASSRTIAHDYAANALRFLPPNAMLFTVGDNDTFPLWYVQFVEGVRRDVIVVNLSLANADWYIDQLRTRYADLPIRAVSKAQRDSTKLVTIPGASPQLVGLADSTSMPDSIRVRPTPRVGSSMIPADWVLLDIVRSNAWRRPLAVSTTAGESGLGWLRPYARLEGLYWRIVPADHPPADVDRVRANLRGGYVVRGYADAAIPLDETSRSIGRLYITALQVLLDADRERGNIPQCLDDLHTVLARVPLDRLGYSSPDQSEVRSHCGS